MSELWQCEICDSLVARDRIDGRCHACGRLTCPNCKRQCDGCTKVFCMNDVKVKKVMRNQSAFLHVLCDACSEWWQ